MVSSENVHLRFPIPDRSYQAVVRSELRRMAVSAGFEGYRLGEIEIIIAEITSNLVKHAKTGGYILAKLIDVPDFGIEFIAVDEGPGMYKSSQMVEDGQSTSKTLGQGLGAIKRLSGIFDLYSIKGWGTILFSRNYVVKKDKVETKVFQFNSIRVSKKDHILCGDSWSLRVDGKKIKIALIDGLGHGALANQASSLAVKSLAPWTKLSPTEELQALHNELKKTRGAVAIIVHMDRTSQQLMYSGVGNIAMKIITPTATKGCFSYNGIVGHIMPASLNNHNLIWNEKTDILIMHSDGIGTRWDIQKYPNILHHHPVILCAALYRDFDRGNDDSTILIGKMLN